MSELRPLLAEQRDEFEVALLRSADHDEPPLGGKLRIATALGLGVGATAGTLAAATGLTVSSGSAGASSAGAKLGIWAILKSLAVGTATGAATLGTLHYADLLPLPAPAPVAATVRAPLRAAPPAPESPPTAPPLVERASASAPAAVEPEPPARKSQQRPEPAAPAPVESAAATEAPPPEPEPEESEPERVASIAGEIAEIDRIRSALRQGHAARALADLERYFRSSPTRVLETEASLLRIDALVALGERERASTLAREFVTRQPTSRYAERLRQLAGE